MDRIERARRIDQRQRPLQNERQSRWCGDRHGDGRGKNGDCDADGHASSDLRIRPGIDAATQASLLAATTADASVVWTYPYDGMAYPRGINAPNMMWNGAANGDDYAIHIVSATYELTEFTTATFPATTIAGTAPAGATSFAFDPAEWGTFVDSTSGPATVTVTRKSGATYTEARAANVEHRESVR